MATSAPKDTKQPPKAKSDPKGKHEPGEDEGDAADAAPPKKKGSLVKMILLIGLPLLIAGGGAAWYFLRDHQPPEENAHAAKAAPAKAGKSTPSKPPAFVPLEPFTVNLQMEDAAQYLQVGLTLKTTDASYTDAIKLNMPDIRNRILLLLSNKKASQIATLEGKQALAAEIMSETAQALGTSVPPGGISNVLFTSFVIQ
jgi:flagellar FliL protein